MLASNLLLVTQLEADIEAIRVEAELKICKIFHRINETDSVIAALQNGTERHRQ